MNYENIEPLGDTEIAAIGGGSIDAEPGMQWLVPPSVGPVGPDGQPEIIPGVALPPVY